MALNRIKQLKLINKNVLAYALTNTELFGTFKRSLLTKICQTDKVKTGERGSMKVSFQV